MTLLGHSDEPAELEGYGPIPADIARELAAQAPSFTRLLTHPETGAILSVGRDRYDVPADLRKALQIRDLTCRHPGCNRKAIRCDIDHTKDWQHGGETELTNLAHLCRWQHTLKHQTKWALTQDENGYLHWTSPLDKHYTTEPDVHLPPPHPPPRDRTRSTNDDEPPPF